MSGTSTCRKCGHEIIWLKTKLGKNIPIDPKPGQAVDDNTIYDKREHACHFDTCEEKQLERGR